MPLQSPKPHPKQGQPSPWVGPGKPNLPLGLRGRAELRPARRQARLPHSRSLLLPGRCVLLQGMFPTQGSNPGLLHCRQILYCLSHQRGPIFIIFIIIFIPGALPQRRVVWMWFGTFPCAFGCWRCLGQAEEWEGTSGHTGTPSHSPVHWLQVTHSHNTHKQSGTYTRTSTHTFRCTLGHSLSGAYVSWGWSLSPGAAPRPASAVRPYLAARVPCLLGSKA